MGMSRSTSELELLFILLHHLGFSVSELSVHILCKFSIFFLADLLYSLDINPLSIFRDGRYLLSILSGPFCCRQIRQCIPL